MVYFDAMIFLFIHSVVCLVLCGVLLLLTYVFNLPKPSSEKNMAYECGFKPFDFTYYPFDIQFYRVGILFLLFDVEILFFFPWVINFYQLSLIAHFSVLCFICLLFFGFLYEMKVGVLIWYPQPWVRTLFYQDFSMNLNGQN